MALSRDATNTLEAAQQQEFQVVNTSVVYAGGLLQLNSSLDATAASRGRIAAWNDEDEAIPIGWAINGITGDTAASPIVQGRVSLESGVLKGVTVAGATGVSSVGLPVYASDDNTFTTTRPTLGIAVGFVSRWITGTTADIYRFSTEVMYVLQLAGAGQQLWNLGVSSPRSSSGNLLTGIQAPHHARILDVYTIVGGALTGAGGSSTVNLEIGGTNLTGGVVTITTAAGAVGTKATDTAITGANVVSEGDLIDVELAVGVGFTGGFINVYAEVEEIPGL